MALDSWKLTAVYPREKIPDQKIIYFLLQKKVCTPLILPLFSRITERVLSIYLFIVCAFCVHLGLILYLQQMRERGSRYQD